MGRAGFGLWVRARVVITLWEGLIIALRHEKGERYVVYTGIRYETQYVLRV